MTPVRGKLAPMSRRVRWGIVTVWIVVGVVALATDRSRLLVAAAIVAVSTQLLVLRSKS